MNAMSKAKLLESIQNGYGRFKELLAGIDIKEMSDPGAVGKWSVKDTAAHIVVHEQRMIQWMKERLRGKYPVMPQPYALPDDDLNELNEQIYQENLNRTSEDVLSDLDRTHVEVLRLVEESRAEDILDPNCFQLQGGEPLWEAIAANTFWHYEEHGQDIQRHRSLQSSPKRSEGDKPVTSIP